MTPLTVTPLALGCEALGATDWGAVDPRQLHAAVRCALDCGIAVFDTADVYGLGRGEEQLSLALGEDRHRVTIVTKGGVRWATPAPGARAKTRRDASAAYLRSALEHSLRRLRVDAIPLYLVHWPDPDTPVGETLECLEQARVAGKIQAYGLSNVGFPQVQAARAVAGVAAVEGPLSLLSPDAALRELAGARGLGLTTLTYGTLAQGLLTGDYSAQSVFDATDRRHRLRHFAPDAWAGHRPLLDEVAAIASEIGRTAAQVSIRWVMDSGVSSTAIVGAQSPDQVLDTVAALSWSLGGAHLARLGAARRRAGVASGDAVAPRWAAT